MKETHFIGHTLVLTALAAITLYFAIDLITTSANPYAW